MKPQQILEEAIEKMGVWVSKHPTGTLILDHRGGRVTIFPGNETWHVKWYENHIITPIREDLYHTDRPDKLAHDLLKWKWEIR